MLITAEIPDELVPWIAEVFSKTYPDITAGLTPSPAIKAVIVSWVRSTLTTYEAERARKAADQAVTHAALARDAAIETARQRAWEVTEQLAVVVETAIDPEPTDESETEGQP